VRVDIDLFPLPFTLLDKVLYSVLISMKRTIKQGESPPARGGEIFESYLLNDEKFKVLKR